MFKINIHISSLLLLLAGNLYCIWYYQQHPNDFATVIWIYWLQSVIIGLFNFADLLTIKNFESGNFKINNAPISPTNKGCMAWFFLLHYGGFHVGYAIFLLVDVGIKNINKNFLLLGISAFLLESLLGFIKRKQVEQKTNLSIATIFFIPYLRVIPMHLTILIPKFTGLQPSMIFLVLKTLADVLSFWLFSKIYSRQKGVGVQ